MYLYLLTNTARSPQKSYVGITSRAVNRRLLEHFSTARNRPTHIAQALKKYGRDAFTLTVLGQAESWEELCAMEQVAIRQHNTFAKISAKTLEQFASQGNPMQGRKHSAETKAKIAAKRRGKPGPNKGKKMGPMSDETKAKQSLAHQGQPAWNKGIPWREIVGGKEHPKARAVEYNGIVYPSVMECHTKTGLARNTIRLYIKQGKAKYMANTILTSRMAGILEGDRPMADATTAPEFPRYGFSATEPGEPVKDSATGATVCNSRLFTSQTELDGAGGTAVWKATPAEAAQAPPPTRTAPAPEDEEETPARRSHR